MLSRLKTFIEFFLKPFTEQFYLTVYLYIAWTHNDINIVQKNYFCNGHHENPIFMRDGTRLEEPCALEIKEKLKT